MDITIRFTTVGDKCQSRTAMLLFQSQWTNDGFFLRKNDKSKETSSTSVRLSSLRLAKQMIALCKMVDCSLIESRDALLVGFCLLWTQIDDGFSTLIAFLML